MNKVPSSHRWIERVVASLLALTLVACGGGGGSTGGSATGGSAPPASSGTSSLRSATALNMTITRVSIHSAPVVDFTVTDQAGTGMPDLTAADLRFNIAKLEPGANGGPSAWQNYINRSSNGAVQGSQERFATGYAFGTLTNHGDGTYTYTFATDITDSAKNPCPAPCTDAEGNPLDISYQPTLLHRVTIQQANSAYPKSTGVFDFVPSGATAQGRAVVSTAKCNECHAQLSAHGTRVDTRLCVTCHNPGSWIATAGQPNMTVDFKVMIHKIHDASELPSATSTPAVPYVIGRTNFSLLGPSSNGVAGPTFPQDVRNCTKCHDGTPGAANATPQGDNWKTQPSMAACGSCHDDVYFGPSPDPAKPYQTVAHPGGVMTNNNTCALCHAAGRFTDNKDIVVAHSFPEKQRAAAAKFQYNIISASPTTPGSKPVVTFSVTDPTNGDAPYDIKTAPAFTAGGNSTLAVQIGWNTVDFNNDGSGEKYGQPVSINALSSAVPGSAAGTYTVTSPVAIPAGLTGTLRVMVDGHPAGDVTTPGSFTDRLPVTSVFKDFAVTGSVLARRAVVDIAKCNACHKTLSEHGNNRTDELGVCVVCHDPNATDAGRRPATAGVLTGGVDGKLEESIDFKRMIHAIHAGESDKGGFRTKGLVVYGYGGSVNDFSNVVFPGVLGNCNACHINDSYQLTGTWAAPKANGILGSTVNTGADPVDPKDNVRITPTAAVCSSCHDDATTTAHITNPFGYTGGSFTDTNGAAPEESCSTCHGPGSGADVSVVHDVK